MGKYTRFTNLEVTDELKLGSMKASTSKVTAADAAAAAGSAPTKAEFDAVVTLANELKAKYNTEPGRRRLPSPRLCIFRGRRCRAWQP